MNIDDLRFTLISRFIENKGERFDDEEVFCGHKTSAVIRMFQGLSMGMVKIQIKDIQDTSADYGDGVTSSEVLCVFEQKTNDDWTGLFKNE